MRHLASLLTLLLTTVVLAQPTITVTNARHDVPELAITGMNHGTFMQIIGLEQDFEQLELRSLRFPPGNIADEFPLDEVTLAAFKQQWKLLGELPVLMVANVFTGSAQEAANAVTYTRELGIDVLAWEVGNEPDLYGPNRDDPSWTAERYCDTFRAYATAIKAQDPNALIAGPAVSGADVAQPYLQTFLKNCGDVVDILTWHIYPTDGNSSEADALASSAVVGESIRRYRQWLRDPEMNPLGYERDIAMGITEFGLSWRTNNYRHLADMTAALWLADAYGQILNEQLDMSHYFALQGTGGHGLIDNTYWKRPTYYVLEMLVPFKGVVLETTTGGADGLRAYATQQEDNLHVLIVNMTDETISSALSLPAGFEQTREVQILSPDAIDKFSDDSPIKHQTIAADAPLNVPAKSVLVLHTTRTN